MERHYVIFMPKNVDILRFPGLQERAMPTRFPGDQADIKAASFSYKTLFCPLQPALILIQTTSQSWNQNVRNAQSKACRVRVVIC